MNFAAGTDLPALASRVSRQKEVMTNMNIDAVYCRSKKNVDDLLVLTNKTLTGRLWMLGSTLLRLKKASLRWPALFPLCLFKCRWWRSD